jgi:anti-sigma regulatory factor (Ser/Thr protein kinase)
MPDASTIELTADPRSPRVARDFVTEVLAAWGLGRLRDEARLVTSELVTNAVLHSRTDLTLVLEQDPERRVLRITIRDGSHVPPRRRHYSELATTGRGLAMVDRAAQAFGTEQLPEGKAVWVELPLPLPNSGTDQAGAE